MAESTDNEPFPSDLLFNMLDEFDEWPDDGQDIPDRIRGCTTMLNKQFKADTENRVRVKHLIEVSKLVGLTRMAIARNWKFDTVAVKDLTDMYSYPHARHVNVTLKNAHLVHRDSEVARFENARHVVVAVTLPVYALVKFKFDKAEKVAFRSFDAKVVAVLSPEKQEYEFSEYARAFDQVFPSVKRIVLVGDSRVIQQSVASRLTTLTMDCEKAWCLQRKLQFGNLTHLSLRLDSEDRVRSVLSFENPPTRVFLESAHLPCLRVLKTGRTVSVTLSDKFPRLEEICSATAVHNMFSQPALARVELLTFDTERSIEINGRNVPALKHLSVGKPDVEVLPFRRMSQPITLKNLPALESVAMGSVYNVVFDEGLPAFRKFTVAGKIPESLIRQPIEHIVLFGCVDGLRDAKLPHSITRAEIYTRVKYFNTKFACFLAQSFPNLQELLLHKSPSIGRDAIIGSMPIDPLMIFNNLKVMRCDLKMTVMPGTFPALQSLYTKLSNIAHLDQNCFDPRVLSKIVYTRKEPDPYEVARFDRMASVIQQKWPNAIFKCIESPKKQANTGNSVLTKFRDTTMDPYIEYELEKGIVV